MAVMLHKRLALSLLLLAIHSTQTRGEEHDASPRITAGVNSQDEWGKTALVVASEQGHTAAALALLRLPGVDANVQDAGGRAALHYAARGDNAELVAALLAHPGADVNVQDAAGYTALHYAVRENNTNTAPLVRALLAAPGADANLQDTAEGAPPLLFALRGGHAEAARALLPRADSALRDASGDTALHWAAYYGNDEVVAELLARPEVAVNQPGKDGEAALARAVAGGHMHVAMRLLKTAGVESRGALNDTVLHCAARQRDVELVKVLADIADIDVNRKDASGRTALMLAVDGGQADIVDALLTAPGVDIDVQDGAGRSALMMAAEKGDAELLGLVASAGGADKCETAEHGCAHRCANTAAGHRCACDVGSRLAADGRSCVMTGRNPYWMICDGSGRITDQENGTIAVPELAKGPPTLTECIWQVDAPRMHRVVLRVDDHGHSPHGPFSVHCLKDSVASVDASGGVVKDHGALCRLPRILVRSATNRLRVRFRRARDRPRLAASFYTEYCGPGGVDCGGDYTDAMATCIG